LIFFASFFGSSQKMKSGLFAKLMSSQARLGEAPIYLGRYWKQTNLHAIDADRDGALQRIE
jgi:hypothetical protein